jgi:hypothetical protein
MLGGGIGATLGAFLIPLGSSDILSNAPSKAAFGRPAPECPGAAEPAARANEAAGAVRTTNNAKATLTGVFDIGVTPLDSRQRRMREADVGSSSADTIKLYFRKQSVRPDPDAGADDRGVPGSVIQSLPILCRESIANSPLAPIFKTSHE